MISEWGKGGQFLWAKEGQFYWALRHAIGSFIRLSLEYEDKQGH